MHIADGVLATEIVLAADAAALGTLFLFGRKTATADIPRMGMTAAALFVASLIHFPLAGTSIHLGLFGLAGILLGFYAFPVILAALLFQSLIFQHGGLLSLGLNALNMGAGAAAAYLFWQWKKIPEPARAFGAGALGILIPAALMGIEFNLSGYGKGIFYILTIYGIAAAIEGAITLSAVAFFRKVNPGIMEKNK